MHARIHPGRAAEGSFFRIQNLKSNSVSERIGAGI